MDQTTSGAYDLLEAGRYDEAYAQFRKLADAGDGWASLYLGWMMQKGLGHQADAAKAERFYLDAHERSVLDAQYYLGCLYRSLKRYREAFHHLEGAASRGHPSAAYWAFVMCSDGEGVPRDEDKASQLLRQAADLGHVYAKRDLAKRMARGKFGLSKIPLGVFSLIANFFSAAGIASSNLEDVRLR